MKHYYDNQLIVILTILIAMGTIVMYSASSHFATQVTSDDMHYLKRHIIALIIGIGSLLAFSTMNYRKLRYLATLGIIISVILLILGYILSPPKTHSRWLIYTDYGKMLTISDAVRIAVIIYLSYYLEKSSKIIGDFKN